MRYNLPNEFYLMAAVKVMFIIIIIIIIIIINNNITLVDKCKIFRT